MFDPERDTGDEGRRFYHRLGLVVVLSLMLGVALLPSVTGFSTGENGDHACIAIRDGWHADRSMSDAQFANAPLEQAAAYSDWRDGSGACVPQSRHRLMLTGIELVVVAGIVVTLRSVRIRDRRRRADNPTTVVGLVHRIGA